MLSPWLQPEHTCDGTLSNVYLFQASPTLTPLGCIGQKPVMSMRQTSVCSIPDKISHVDHSNILIHRGVTGHGSERELMTTSER